MKIGKTATLIGATGLIGGELLNELLNDPYFETVKILIRRPLDITHPKLEKKLVDFSDGDSMLVAMDNSDVIFCSIGTTQKKVKGDMAAYRKVDYDIAVNAARFCKMTGCKIFVLVSALGANSKASNFYLKLKGEVEDAVKATGVETIHVMRPSVLIGKRENENRPMERLMGGLMQALSFLIPSKYRAIHSITVAKAMLRLSKDNKPGFHIYEGAEMRKMIK